MVSLMLKAQRLLQHFENRILASLFGGHHGPAPAIAGIEDFQPHVQEETSLKEEGFLWAVPKHRRTKQIRLNRKFGWPEHVWKPFVPKTNLVVCDTCGHHHISGYLCGTCYKRVMKETEEIQKTIEASSHLQPTDKEVIVLYEEEALPSQSEFVNGKRIVEMKKKRPSWFSSNLTQKSTATGETSTKDVPASELA
ncbi:ribosomal protein L32 [Nesidiocoris tenuis]|uniref:Large ribosomal subunit protein bL32m n=1 Tax=Nesidiocoris tenuis TaxID=355587 RepID=A0ABN7AUX7_9HEMI|nr:ribosomal protein L32 [Nesidiocoris tenuis]